MDSATTPKYFDDLLSDDNNEFGGGANEEGVGSSGSKDNESKDNGDGCIFDEIPELPTGKVLRLELLSSWDDPDFIGLGRIELFTDQGVCPLVKEICTNAVECNGDLRRLLEPNRKYAANDDQNSQGLSAESNLWLCNYHKLSPDSKDPNVHICIRFENISTLAMIRIWNYSDSSRVHTIRGVRDMCIWLDQKCIFKGEICCCSVSTGLASIEDDGAEQGDTILFTTNENILARIAENDEQISKMASGNVDAKTSTLLMPDCKQPTTAEAGRPELNRPATGFASGNSFPVSAMLADSSSSIMAPQEQRCEEEEVLAADRMKDLTENYVKGEVEEICEEEEEETDENICIGKVFHIELLDNWGCPDAIGLTGIQFLGPKFLPLEDSLTKQCVVRCEPAVSMTSPSEHCAGCLMNLLNGHNLTCNANEMLLIHPKKADARNSQIDFPTLMLSFTFPNNVGVSGISVWNYNASPELSYAGVRCARFYANGRPINGMDSVLLRKAPGFVFFDFVQDILFDRCPLFRPISNPRPQTRSVAAFIFQLRLLSSWGDEFYIGLNGIELFNRHDHLIRLRPHNLAAFPESVNCLANVDGTDPRSSDKLIDNVNDTTKAHHMWLTPILPNTCARVFIIFDTPTFVTRFRIYNYRKTSERGVRHIALSADDLLLCSGAEVPMSTAERTGILDLPMRDFD